MACTYTYRGKEYTENNYNKFIEKYQTYPQEVRDIAHMFDNISRTSNGVVIKTLDNKNSQLYNELVEVVPNNYAPDVVDMILLEEGIIKDLSKPEIAISLYLKTYGNKFFQEKGHWIGDSNRTTAFGELPLKEAYPGLKKEDSTPYIDKNLEPKVEQAVQDFLEEFGIKVSEVDQILNEKGQVIDAYGKLDVFNRMIEIARGKNIAITEEAVHLALIMLRGTPLHDTLMKQAETLPNSDVIRQEYEDVYDSELKIGEEIIAKEITRHLNEERSETPTESETILDLIWNYIKKFFRAIVNQSTIADNVAKVANMVIEGNYKEFRKDNLDSITSNDFYFWKIDPNDVNLEFQEKIKEHLKRDKEAFTGMINSKYTFNNEVYPTRVSMIVDRIMRRYEGDKDFSNKTYARFAADKGTLVHRYIQAIWNKKLQKKKYTQSQIEKEVKAELLNDEAFKNSEWWVKKDAFYTLFARDFEMLVNGVTRMHKEILEMDPNAYIISEAMVRNNKEGVDKIAGTLDLLVIFSDGSAAIYDYKTTSFKKFGHKGRYSELNWRKVLRYDAQISQYKALLAEAYGIKKWRHTRVVPINIIHYLTDKGGIQHTNTARIDMYTEDPPSDRKRDYEKLGLKELLRPIPLGKELTGDEGRDRQLRKLFNQKEKLKEEIKRAGNKEIPKQKLSSINKAIAAIQLEEDITKITGQIYGMINKANKILDTLDKNELLSFIGYLTTYEQFNVDFRKYVEENYTKEDARETKDQMDKMAGELVRARARMDNRLIELIHDETDLNILEGVKELSAAEHLFGSVYDRKNPAIIRVNQLLRKEEWRRTLALREFEREFSEIDNAFAQWAKSRGRAGVSMFKYLNNPATGNLKGQYNKKFWEEYEAHRKVLMDFKAKQSEKTKAIKFFESVREFDREMFNKARAAYENSLRSLEVDKTEKEIQDDLRAFDSRTDPAVNPRVWAYRTKFFQLKEGLSSEYYSDLWNEALKKGNEPLKNYLEFYWKKNIEAAKVIGFDRVSKNQTLNIPNSLIDNISEGELTALGKIRGLVGDALKTQSHEHFGVIINEEGQPIMDIPVPFLAPYKAELSSNRKEKIRKEVAKEIGEDNVDFHNEVYLRIRAEEYNEGRKNKSKDLSKSLRTFMYYYYTYKYMNEIKDDILAIRHIMQNHQREVVTDRQNMPYIDRIYNEKVRTEKGKRSTLQDFDAFITERMFGQQIQSKDFNFRLKSLTAGAEEAGISGNKTIKFITRYQSHMAIALNPILATANFFNALFNQHWTSIEGIYYDQNTRNQAVKLITKGDAKMTAALLTLEPTQRNLHLEKATLKSRGWIRKIFNDRNAYIFHLKGDEAVDNIVMGAMLLNHVWDSDGKIKSKTSPYQSSTIIDKNAPTLYDMIKVDEKTGEMTIKHPKLNEEQTLQTIADFRGKFFAVTNKIKGSISPDQMIIANQSIWGYAAMRFRNWMPGLIQNRFQKLSYNKINNDYDVGRFAVAIAELIESPGFLPKITEFGKMLGQAITMGLYNKKPNKVVAEAVYNRYIKENPEMDLTLEQFLEMRRRKLKSLGHETGSVLYLSILSGMLIGLGWNDPEDENFVQSMFKRTTYQGMRRTYLELSFFYSPQSIDEIISSPVPLWRLVRQTQRNLQRETESLYNIANGIKNDRRSPLGSPTSRQIPYLNQVLSFGGFYETRKESSFYEGLFKP